MYKLNSSNSRRHNIRLVLLNALEHLIFEMASIKTIMYTVATMVGLYVVTITKDTTFASWAINYQVPITFLFFATKTTEKWFKMKLGYGNPDQPLISDSPSPEEEASASDKETQ